MTTLTDDLKKTAVDTGYVVVGITDLAVERVRATQASAQKRAADVRKELDSVSLQASVQQARQLPLAAKQLPTTAVSKGLEAAGRVEEGFDELAGRGKKLVERIRRQKATQELVEQGRTTLSRTKAAVTTVRRGTKDTTTAAKATVTTATRQAEKAAESTRTTATKSASSATKATKAPAKRTATTARKRAAASKSATKGAATTARKTAASATKAASAAADKVGS